MLAAAFERAGLSVWWDPHIDSGDEFARTIERELNAAKAVVVCWSRTANDSAWVKDEAGHARDQGKLIPLTLDGARPPLGFRQFQAADFSAWNGGAGPEIEALVDVVRRRISGEAPTMPPRLAKAPLMRKLFRPAPLALAVALVTAAGVGLYAWSDRTARNPLPKAELEVETTPSIAVLPFKNLSAAAEDAYFADGMTEEMLTGLARIAGLRVVSRSSAFHFRNSTAKIGDIAAALGVGHILEGSIRRSGGTIRITAQLIDARTDAQLWSEKFDRPLTADSLFAVQDEIAQAVVEQMKGRLSLQAADHPSLRTSSTEAYEAYLRGRQLREQRRKETVLAAIESLKKAIELDPAFAPAYYELELAYLMGIQYAGFDEAEALALALPLVEKVEALAPGSSEAMGARANILDSPIEQLKFSDRRVAENPNDARAHFARGSILISLGRFAESVTSLKQARLLDPLNPEILVRMTLALLAQGEIDAAFEVAGENLKWNPEAHGANLWFGVMNEATGKYDVAHRHYKAEEALNSLDWVTRNALFMLYADLGMDDVAAVYADGDVKKGWLALLDRRSAQAIALLQEDSGGRAAVLAHVLGQHETAYALFRRDYSKRDRSFLPPMWEFDSTAALQEFERARDPDATTLRRLLVERFDRKPLDPGFNYDLIFGAAWRALNGDEKGALEAIDAMIAGGFVFRRHRYLSAFDGLRERPEFESRMAKLDAVAARWRGEIEDQLAKPEPGWVEPLQR